jgi:hypothetical protein
MSDNSHGIASAYFSAAVRAFERALLRSLRSSIGIRARPLAAFDGPPAVRISVGQRGEIDFAERALPGIADKPILGATMRAS